MTRRARTAEAPHVAGCACGTHGDSETDRRTTVVDTEAKAANTRRLRRIEGQVRGLQRMIEEDRYCPDVLTQIASVHEALRSVGRELMRHHLRHCATQAIRSGDHESTERTYDELVDLMYRSAR